MQSEIRVSSRQKVDVKKRAKYCCEYCCSQEAYSPDAFSVEHIVPLVKDGTNLSENLANACQGCNNRKFVHTEAVDPLTGELVPLYHPRQHDWAEHFAWNADYTKLLPLTATGRATVEKLDLNRKGVVNLRRLLHEKGLHPPA